ncbi:ATP-binding protein [Dictyobacter aurantiacus]|nr:ATP-binding protein [Dictyobacter aurantiacus]
MELYSRHSQALGNGRQAVMERLNEIFERTGRRQPLSEQQAQGRTPQQGQGHLKRRFNTDRTNHTELQSRSGQRYNSNTPSQPASYSHNYPSRARHYSNYQQENGGSDGRPVTEPISRADHPIYPPSYPRRNVSDAGSPYHPQPHQDQQRIQPLQPRPTSNYHSLHSSDTYVPDSRADVVEEWEENGLTYGDWEQEGGDYDYEDEEIEAYDEPAPSTYQPPAYRQRSQSDTMHGLNTETPARGMRTNLHDSRLASAIANQQARSQELPASQRVTQPLNPHTIRGVPRGERSPLSRPGPSTSSRHLKPVRPEVEQAPQDTEPAAVNNKVPAKSICPKCRGAGFLRADVPFGHPNFGKPIPCVCKESERKEKRRQQLRDMSNMDAFRNQSFRSFSLHTPGVQEAYDAATRFASNPQGWLLLIGPNGCGKTHLAAAIANLSLDSGAVVLFEAVPDLLDHLRAAFAPTATEVYDQLFSKMREAELLVLDDLGAQQSSPWANEKLFQLLNYRYNLSMPTVITANPKGLQGIDERIRSRLHDTYLVREIVMDRARDHRPFNGDERRR